MQNKVFVEASVLLSDLVGGYIDYFKFRDEKKIKSLMDASAIIEETHDGVKAAIARTVGAMHEIEYNATGELNEYVRHRKNLEQVKSIVYIGQTFPEKAIKRMKGLRTKLLVS